VKLGREFLLASGFCKPLSIASSLSEGSCLQHFQVTFVIAFSAFYPLCSIQGEESSTLRARLGEGSSICGELAIRVITTAIEDALLT